MTGGARCIKLACEAFLVRQLTEEETILVEELALNFFPNAIVHRIHALYKKKVKKDFSVIYTPIMRGSLGGQFSSAVRRMSRIRIEGHLRELYLHFSSWAERDLQNAEMEAILILSTANVTLEEVQAACLMAERRGIRRVNYVKGIIDGNRNVAAMRMSPRNFKDAATILAMSLDGEGGTPVPRVDLIRKRWQAVLQKASEDKVSFEADARAKKSIEGREGTE